MNSPRAMAQSAADSAFTEECRVLYANMLDSIVLAGSDNTKIDDAIWRAKNGLSILTRTLAEARRLADELPES